MALFGRRHRTKQTRVTTGRSSNFGCVQCGTHSNPCRCKVIGPTLGVVAFAVAAVVEWPVGAVVYIFKHVKGRRIMAHPATHVYPKVSRCIPI